jgi:hypothetical protein
VLLYVAVAEHYQVDRHQVVAVLDMQYRGHCHAHGLRSKFERSMFEEKGMSCLLEADYLLFLRRIVENNQQQEEEEEADRDL